MSSTIILDYYINTNSVIMAASSRSIDQTVEYAWVQFKSSIRRLRQQYMNQFDGKKFWSEFKDPLDSIKATVSFNSQKIAGLYKELTGKAPAPKEQADFSTNFGEDMEEFNPDGSSRLPQHFFVQLFRIPIYEATGLKKLFQLALNIGQLEAQIAQLPKRLIEFVELHGLRNIETFVSVVTIDDPADIPKFKIFSGLIEKYNSQEAAVKPYFTPGKKPDPAIDQIVKLSQNVPKAPPNRTGDNRLDASSGENIRHYKKFLKYKKKVEKSSP